MSHAAVSPRQRDRAKQLRTWMTRAETLLWRYLKAHHVDELGFRRQVPMGKYVADFACHAPKLIVEIDGASHDFAEQIGRDEKRDAWFKSRGYAVLRFTNSDVMKNLEGVVGTIRETAASRLDAPPSLSLPRKGGGNPRTDTSVVTKPRVTRSARGASR